MDLEKVLAQLRTELRNLDSAIASLEHLHQSPRRRGRPPSWLAGADKASSPKRSGKSRFRKADDGSKSS